MTAGTREHVAEVAADHPRVARREAAGEVVYEVEGQAIAVLRGPTVEFRLRGDVVGAALRTPGTSASVRGPEWVAFEPPPTPDRYDVDRLRSWFEMAARLAGG